MVICGGRFPGTVGSCQELWSCRGRAFGGLTSDKKIPCGSISVFAANHHKFFRRVEIGSVNPNLTGIREDGPDLWSDVDRCMRATRDIENSECSRGSLLEQALDQPMQPYGSIDTTNMPSPSSTCAPDPQVHQGSSQYSWLTVHAVITT